MKVQPSHSDGKPIPIARDTVSFAGYLCTCRNAYRSIMLDTPFKIYMQAAVAGVSEKWRR